MSSLAAPEIHSSGKHYQRIMVIVSVGNLAIRREAEDRFAAEHPDSMPKYDTLGVASYAQYTFLPGYTLLFPGRVYTADQIAEIVRQNRIDAVLTIDPLQSGVQTTTGPSSYHTACTTGLYATNCLTKETEGPTVQKPWARFEANLFDATTGESVWYATARTAGNGFASWSTVVRSMENTTVRRMETDGVIE